MITIQISRVWSMWGFVCLMVIWKSRQDKAADNVDMIRNMASEIKVQIILIKYYSNKS